MDLKQQVTEWVEKKFGKIIKQYLEEQINSEDSELNVNHYVNDLLNSSLRKNDLEKLEKEIFKERVSRSEPDLSKVTFVEGSSKSNSFDSLEFEQTEFTTTEEIIKNLKNPSIDVRLKWLKVLETCPEDFINPTVWNVIRKVLQNTLERKGDKKLHMSVLKVFQRFLMCPNKPQIVCEGFITLAELTSFHLERFNSRNSHILMEELYDFKENKWVTKEIPPSESGGHISTTAKPVEADILIKSMWLLIECQKQMPEKWIRFSEKRLREVIFAFIHLLASTSSSGTGISVENAKLSGLELLSILNPTASWCRHWCHTSVGRSLLCSALRKYKRFFTHIVEIILISMKATKLDVVQSESQTTEKDAKILERNLGKEVVANIPQKIITQATFHHCMSLIVILVQYRRGRSLFPVQASSRKRLLSVQDLAISMIDFLESSELNDVIYTHEYRHRVAEMLKVLKSVKETIVSSRMSANRIPLSSR